MKAFLLFIFCRPGEGRGPVSLLFSQNRKSRWTPAFAGATVSFLMTTFLAGWASSTWAVEDHSPHVHEAAPPPVLTPEKPETERAYPPPTTEEMAAAFPDLGGMSMQDHMGGQSYGKFLLDRLEAQDADVATGVVWDARASWGSEFNRLWFSSEGEFEDGKTSHLESRLYGSHAFSSWWEATAGLRQDGGEGPDRTWAGVGVQGLAPYFFELDASVWIGEGGRTAVSLEAEYELLLSNRLILQPRMEMNAYGKADPAKGIGNGLSDAELGLRLRYEIRREIAPYIGVEWSRRFGDTADRAAANGERSSDARALMGIGLWF